MFLLMLPFCLNSSCFNKYFSQCFSTIQLQLSLGLIPIPHPKADLLSQYRVVLAVLFTMCQAVSPRCENSNLNPKANLKTQSLFHYGCHSMSSIKHRQRLTERFGLGLKLGFSHFAKGRYYFHYICLCIDCKVCAACDLYMYVAPVISTLWPIQNGTILAYTYTHACV